MAHRKDLDAFIAGLNLDEETRNRALKNPLRLFDDKRDEIKDAMSKAPLLLDYLNAESRENFEQVKSALDSLGIAYQVNPRMVRGLDYYTGTTFEFVHSGLGAQSGIGGGGRYDGLMELLGGSKLSGIGFGLGIDRILLALEAEAESGQLLPGELKYIDLYVIALGDQARTKCFTLVDSLRKEGFVVEQNFGDRSLKAAMKAADKSGARFAIVLGDSELESASVELKEMSSGELTSVRLTYLAKTLAEKSSGL